MDHVLVSPKISLEIGCRYAGISFLSREHARFVRGRSWLSIIIIIFFHVWPGQKKTLSVSGPHHVTRWQAHIDWVPLRTRQREKDRRCPRWEESGPALRSDGRNMRKEVAGADAISAITCRKVARLVAVCSVRKKTAVTTTVRERGRRLRDNGAGGGFFKFVGPREATPRTWRVVTYQSGGRTADGCRE